MTTRRAAAAPRRSGSSVAAVLGHGDLVTSLIWIFPLFVAYEVGVMFAPALNGVDFVTRTLYSALGGRLEFLLFHLGLASLYGGFLLVAGGRRRGDGHFLPMLLESGLIAFTTGTLIVFVMQRLLGVDPRLAVGVVGNAATALVVSLGAGVHEELIFRLGLCAGGAALLRTVGLSHGLAVTLAFLGSSALFSAAHHLGASGDPFALGVFVYRLLAGLLFAAVFYFRSLAHAVYAHALYDFYVLVVLR